MYIFQCSLTLTMALHVLRGRWWPIVCTPSDALHNFQKGCIPGAVCMQLPDLTNPQGYIRLHMLSLVMDCLIWSSAEVLTQYYSAMYSAAHAPMIGDTFMCLSVILLVDKCHFWLGRMVENNARCKTFLFPPQLQCIYVYIYVNMQGHILLKHVHISVICVC